MNHKGSADVCMHACMYVYMYVCPSRARGLSAFARGRPPFGEPLVLAENSTDWYRIV